MELLQEERNPTDHGTRRMSEVAAFDAQLSKRKRLRMKRSMRPFEKRYSNLAQKGSLVPERKRIDYVLVYHCYDDAEEASKKRKLHKQESNRRKFEHLMEGEGFSIQKDTVGNHVYVKLHCPFKRLCYEAEKVKIQMPLKDCKIPPSKPGNFFKRFIDEYMSTDADVADFVSCPFEVDKIDKFEHHEDPTHFFRPAVRSLLVNHILINLDIRTAREIEEDASDSEEENEKGNCCSEMCKNIFFCCQQKNKNLTGIDKKNGSSMKKKGLPYLLMKESYSDSFVLHDDSIKSRQKEDLQSDHFTEVDGTMKPLDVDPRKELDDKWTKFFKFQPLWHIRDYFGEKIAFYFAWTGMLITTLWIPMLFGLCVFFYGLYESVNESLESRNSTQSLALTDVLGDIKRAFDNELTPIFALFICCWDHKHKPTKFNEHFNEDKLNDKRYGKLHFQPAMVHQLGIERKGTIFLEVWKRDRATLAYEWDVDMFEATEPDRPQFFGTQVKKDPVTQEDNMFYPFRRQVMKLATSCSVLFIMMSVVIISVLAVIVYRVIIGIDYCPSMDHQTCFFLTTIISSVLNAVSILILGKLYDKLAVVLTDWENHRTQTIYDDALIIKLFAFQFVNSYASCFYIAFIRGRGSIFNERYVDFCEGSCMTQLSFQVLILMVAKPFPKFFKDIILPFLKKLWQIRPAIFRFRCSPCFRQNQVKDTDETTKDKKHHKPYIEFLERERLKPSLGDFTMGEYTEKVILYGFLMLFASSFPLAPLLALVICYIDIRVDAKRMLWWYRRPVAYIAEDIGMWFDILTLVNFAGVLTNAFIIAFTSNWGKQFDLQGKLWVVIGFEHLVFVLKFILAYLIPDIPQDVRLAIRREQYIVQKKFNEGISSGKDVDFTHLFPADLMPRNVITEEDEGTITTSSSKFSHHANNTGDHSSVINDFNETGSPTFERHNKRKKSKSIWQILSKRHKGKEIGLD